jgi:hypothetical protein
VHIVAADARTEQDVIQSLSAEARALLQRVLQIERSKSHLKADDPTEELLDAVKQVIR